MPVVTKEQIIAYLTRGIAALFAIMLHEIAHGYAAHRLGDETARDMGRLSLNPIRHVDWFGLLMLILVGFGWAKPVPIDMRYFQNPKRDMCLVALAGPGMNFALAFVTLIIYALGAAAVPEFVADFLIAFALINVGLGVFNLFPIPPLDGSKAIGILIPDHIYYKILQYERYGMMALMLLLFTGVLNGPLSFLRGQILDGMWWVALKVTGNG
ncbi:peptidase M50 [Clostridia bacterium]|nr:peptidase M50 [Clostridia bacterium]